MVSAPAAGTTTATIGLYENSTGGPYDLYTRDSSGTHTHTLSYGINDDSTYPGAITIAINGTDRTTALGGTWGSTGSSAKFEVDITSYINGEANIYKTHTITIGCGSGQGRIEASIEVVADTQTLAVS